jgi:hypothetical protein
MAEVLETQEQFPVKAGVQVFSSWIPAFAGMTISRGCDVRETP